MISEAKIALSQESLVLVKCIRKKPCVATMRMFCLQFYKKRFNLHQFVTALHKGWGSWYMSEYNQMTKFLAQCTPALYEYLPTSRGNTGARCLDTNLINNF